MDMGGVTDDLHGVEGLGFLRRKGNIRDEDFSAWPADTDHLRQNFSRVEKMVEAVAGQNQRKGIVCKGQGQAGADLPGDIGDLLIGLVFLRLRNHGRGDVQPGDMGAMAGEGAGNDSRSTGHIQHLVRGCGSSHLDQEVDGIVMTVYLGKRDCLAGKLFDDGLLMREHAGNLCFVVDACLHYSLFLVVRFSMLRQ